MLIFAPPFNHIAHSFFIQKLIIPFFSELLDVIVETMHRGFFLLCSELFAISVQLFVQDVCFLSAPPPTASDNLPPPPSQIQKHLTTLLNG